MRRPDGKYAIRIIIHINSMIDLVIIDSYQDDAISAVILNLQAGQFESALSRASLLHELEPEDQQVDQLLTTLRQSMSRGR